MCFFQNGLSLLSVYFCFFFGNHIFLFLKVPSVFFSFSFSLEIKVKTMHTPCFSTVCFSSIVKEDLDPSAFESASNILSWMRWICWTAGLFVSEFCLRRMYAVPRKAAAPRKVNIYFLLRELTKFWHFSFQSYNSGIIKFMSKLWWV